MKFRQIKFVIFAVPLFFLVACNDSPKEPEPVDIQATEQINDKLLNSMREISNEQQENIEDSGTGELEALSEQDRQSLIDLTIDESSEVISDDANKMVDLLEEINGISE